MKRYSLFFLAILSGCLTSNSLQYQTVSTENQYHLARVRKGMSQLEVLRIMHKPYSYESFEFDDEIYDVWFYVTRPTGLDQSRMVPQNLTPLTFRNGILVGTSYNYYYYAMKEQAGEIEAQKPKVEKPKTQAEEDKSFEEALKKLQEQRNPPAQNVAPPQQVQPQPQVEQATPKAQPKTETPHAAPKPKEIKATPQTKKSALPQKKAPHKEKEKLPPNVHIIGQNEIPLKETESCFPQPAPVLQCPCPTSKSCDPNRFSVLTKGMTEKQVHRFFGEPLKFETFDFCYDHYDAWFYDTIPSKSRKKPTVPQNQTVLIFKNAVLISMEEELFWGLKKMKDAHEVAANAPMIRTVKQEKFSNLQKGVTEETVQNELGEPNEKDTICDGSNEYHIWYYELETKKGTRTLPLTFKNGILVGKTSQESESITGKPCKGCLDQESQRMLQDESEQNFDFW